MTTKKCLKLLGSGVQLIPGTWSDCSVLVYLTTLGLGPYIIFVEYSLIINNKQIKNSN